MTTTKRLTAIFLCIAMLFGFGSASTSAYEAPNSGELTEGKNQITADEYSYEFCFDFYADESGYYSITSEQADLDIFKESNNQAEDTTEFINKESCVYLYYLEKGTYNIFAYYYGGEINIATDTDAPKPVTGFEIDIEHYGEITDIEFDEEAYTDIIFEDYFSIEKDSNGNEYIRDYVDCTVIFSSGKTIDCHDHLKLICKEKFVNGRNNVTADFGIFKKETVLTGYYITYFVKSVELLEYPTAYQTYRNDNDYIYDGVPECKFRVNFTDGTSEETKSTVILPNGEEIYVISSFWDDATVKVYIGDHKFIEKKLPIEEASYKMNYNYMTRLVKYHFSSIKDDWYYVFIGKRLNTPDMTLADHYYYIAEIMPDLLSYTSSHLRYSVYEITLFLNYYIGTPIIFPWRTNNLSF